MWLWIFNACFYTNHEFENRTFDWVRLIFFLFGEFDFVRLPNLIELNLWIEFDLVRFGSIYYGRFMGEHAPLEARAFGARFGEF